MIDDPGLNGRDDAMLKTPPARPDREPPARADLALVLSGGGARGAYQVGVLRGLTRLLPDLRFSIITGVSAGAINATFMAAHPGSSAEAASELADLWMGLKVENIFRVDSASLARYFAQWAARFASGSVADAADVAALVDTRPLDDTIRHASATVDGEYIGIERNIERGKLKACALTALNYTTGQTVTWVQGHNIPSWHQPRHRSVHARICVEHVMASSSLPLFFPAVRLGDTWYGDGGIRLSTPLVPALRLGADRILAISPSYEPSVSEAERPKSRGYPPPAQILGHLVDAVFLDVLDEDVRRLQSLNSFLAKLPPEERGGLRHVDTRILRPSLDLGELAAQYEPRLPAGFRYLVNSLGTRETNTSDFLSMVMFQPDYLERLIEIGEADAESRVEEVRELVDPHPYPSPAPSLPPSPGEGKNNF